MAGHRYSAKVGFQQNRREILRGTVVIDPMPTQTSVFGKVAISNDLRKVIHSELVPKLLHAIHAFREEHHLDMLREVTVLLGEGASTPSPSTLDEDNEPFSNWQPREPDGSFERLVLSESTLGFIDQAGTSILAAAKVFDEWGFKQNFHGRRPACVLNFYGPPGTGKTATANALAKRLGVPILVAEYSQIESKYVGDSAKNLDGLFEQAQQSGALLLFDEADILLSRRVSSQSSSDHALNALRTTMLLWLERFSGVCVLATNSRESYDRAFDRRILYDIPFSLPSEAERHKILASHLPKQAPLAHDADLPIIAGLLDGFSGADIRDTVLKAALAACQEDADSIELRHFQIAATQIRSARHQNDSNRWMADRAEKVSAKLAETQ